MTTPLPKLIDLPENTILMSERNYEAAIECVISHASQQLCIFDQDLSCGGFASLKIHQLLLHFLSQNIASQLTIILQDTHYFETHCPRLNDLLRTYGHKMAVFETNQTAKHVKECFILADGQHYIKRIHIDHARFKYALHDEPSTMQLSQRFEELRETTNHPLAVNHLGL